MRLEEALKRRKEMFEKRLEIRIMKGHDYASTENVLANFEVTAEVCRLLNIDITKPWGVALFYIIVKIARAANLLFNVRGPAQCEALEDTIAIDLPNYVDLLDEILFKHGLYQHKENKNINQQKTA